MNADLGKLLSVKDVLAYLHIGRTTLHRMMKSRKIGFVRVGKKIFFTQDHIEAFIRKGTVPPKK
jgi:excisionase family DNA binding protein